MTNDKLTYEVFYGTGGHSGPFQSDIDAANHAIRQNEKTFVVAARSKSGVSGYLPLNLYRWVSSTEFERHGWLTLTLARIPMMFRWMIPVGEKH